MWKISSMMLSDENTNTKRFQQNVYESFSRRLISSLLNGDEDEQDEIYPRRNFPV